MPPDAVIIKTCKRFEALGYNQPKTGCYIFCSSKCAAKAQTEDTLAAASVQHGSAGTLLASAGIDLTMAQKDTDRRTDWEKLPASVQAALSISLTQPPDQLASQVTSPL